MSEQSEQAKVIEAQRALADRTVFTLDDDAWEAFIELLERPAQVNEGLVRLFSTPSVFAD